MKKLLLLCIVATLSFACSSNDNTPEDGTENPIGEETPTPPTDTKNTIIGAWKLVQRNGQEITDTCAKKDTYAFNEDGTYTFEDYNKTTGPCIKDEKESFKGTWKNNEDETYNIKKHGFTGPGVNPKITFTTDKQLLTFTNSKLTYKRQ